MTSVNLGSFFNGLLPTILAIIVPILTAFVTKVIVNVTKQVDAFAVSRPWVKQVWAFIVATVLSLVLAVFGTTSLGVILNTLIAGGLAMLLHNGSKLATLNVSLSGTSLPAMTSPGAVSVPVSAVVNPPNVTK